ncbi:MAG: 1-(5-phosphoribosyl)-5-[(5-phosphoribosylamino)methylideneamino]imidazole-4-carboxamide isomerase [Bacteroidetes bacterium]|nr:1-(5-phosphoribosyl)-5-[(5-phosphoribosylamino)methylideneamino]imidazole-4-carboxamide isomerase [Bacteroidota bacterium]
MRIIPAIDIIEGKCIRLIQGDYERKIIYNENPLEVAKQFEDNGIQYLHLVDLDGAKAKKIINRKVLEEIDAKTKLKIDFGGGIRTDKDIKLAFNCGADQVTGGSIAVKNKELFLSWLDKFGPEKIILGADVKEEKITINGWYEKTEINIFPFIENYRMKGIKYFICTDINRDGLLQGTAINLYKKITDRFTDIKLIASGGITSTDEIDELIKMNLDGVIIGKAIYENKISLKELRKYVG